MLYALFLICLSASPAWAGPQVATLAAIQGEVKIFSHPHKDSPQGPPPHAKYEGLYYSARDAKVGDRVEKDNIIRTQTGGRARVIYDNGDQIYVAAASSYKITWDKDTADGNPELELRYGKGRFVIQKGGPRGKFKIKTKSAVLGVRGTDFFVAVNDATGQTETATLRGAVDVKPPIEGVDATTVTTGQTASVPAPVEAAPRPEVTLHQTTKAELQAVQRSSVLTDPAPTPPQAADTVKNLEAVAEKATLEDIRTVDPAQAQTLEQAPQGKPTLDQINQSTIDGLSKAAPTKGAVGPIADQTLEKPKGGDEKKEEKVEEKKQEEKPQEKKDDNAKKEDPEPQLPKIWVGIKGGPRTSALDNQRETQLGNVRLETSDMDDGGGALSVELELGRNFSIFGEVYPSNKHGSEFNVSCTSGCTSSDTGRFELKLRSFDVFVGLKPQLPFGRTRWFAIHAALGAGLVRVTSANIDGPMSTDITDTVSRDHPIVGGGFGVSVRPLRFLKISAEFRATHSVGEISNNFVQIGAASTQLKGFSDIWGLLGVAIGL